MEELKDECVSTISHKLIVCEEQRSKITFDNKTQKEIKKVQVDGCQIKDQDKLKCDFLLIESDSEKEYFIELKGHDINQAIRQLEATIPRLSQNSKTQMKFCFVISVRTPMSSPEIQLKQKQFRQKYNANLIIKNSPHQHKL